MPFGRVAGRYAFLDSLFTSTPCLGMLDCVVLLNRTQSIRPHYCCTVEVSIAASVSVVTAAVGVAVVTAAV